MAREGAAHLYMLDFVEAQLQALATSLRTEFPAVKVNSTSMRTAFHSYQFTTVAADAASSSAISNLVDRALAEEGHLDFFFANAGISQLRPKGDVHSLEMLQRLTRTAVDIPEEEYTEIMRINALR
jgi:NAD(P)-dependent dehydrogenase (short-subunit alcohol dehydrogenase family)